MTKRLYTAEKVLGAVLTDVDDDQDYDDPDELVMDGSDDEFSDLELEDDFDSDQLPTKLSLSIITNITSFTIPGHATTAFTSASRFT